MCGGCLTLCCFQGHFEGKNLIKAAHHLGTDEPAVSGRCVGFLLHDLYQLDSFDSYKYVFFKAFLLCCDCDSYRETDKVAVKSSYTGEILHSPVITVVLTIMRFLLSSVA